MLMILLALGMMVAFTTAAVLLGELAWDFFKEVRGFFR